MISDKDFRRWLPVEDISRLLSWLHLGASHLSRVIKSPGPSHASTPSQFDYFPWWNAFNISKFKLDTTITKKQNKTLEHLTTPFKQILYFQFGKEYCLPKCVFIYEAKNATDGKRRINSKQQSLRSFIWHSEWHHIHRSNNQSFLNKYIIRHSKKPSFFFINIVHTTSNPIIMITAGNYNDNGKTEEQKQYNLQSVHALSIMTFMSLPFLTCHVTVGGDALQKQRERKIINTAIVNSIATTDETLKDIKLSDIIFWHWVFITYIMKIYNLPTTSHECIC